MGSTKSGYPNAAGSADPSLFRLYLSRLWHQKHLYVCWFKAPSSSTHKSIAKEETERAALFQSVSPLLVSSIKPWRVTTFSCFHLRGISWSQGGYCNKSWLIPNHLRAVCHRFTLTLLRLCCLHEFQICHLKRGGVHRWLNVHVDISFLPLSCFLMYCF